MMSQSRHLASAAPEDAPPPGQQVWLTRAAWLRIAPFATWLAFMLLAQGLERLGVARDTLRWLYPLQALTVLLILACCWRHYDELHGLRLSLLQVLLAVGAGLMVLLLWVQLTAPWMTLGASSGFDPRNHGRVDWLLASSRLAGSALVVPVMEELFWRSFLMRWMHNPQFQLVDPARLGVAAFAVPTILFGIEHTLWLAGMVAGLGYALLYRTQRSLAAPILAHVVTNAGLGFWVLASASWHFW